MTPIDLPIPQDIPWLVWLLLFVCFGPPLLASKAAAKLPWVFGKLGRWWQNRRPSPESIITTANLQNTVEKMVEDKVAKIKAEVEVLADYLAYDAAWHRRADIHAGEEGWEFPPPPHMNLKEWMDENDVQIPS